MALVFGFSTWLTSEVVGQYHQLISSDESRPQSFSFEEINPKGLDQLKAKLESITPSIPQSELNTYFNELKRTKTIHRHVSRNEIPKMSLYPFLAIWGGALFLSVFFMTRPNKVTDKASPLLVKSLDHVEYPVLMMDSALNIIWQNKKSSTLNYGPSNLEKIVDESVDGSEIVIESKSYTVMVTELKSSKGPFNYLAHLIPKKSTQSRKEGQIKNISKIDQIETI